MYYKASLLISYTAICNRYRSLCHVHESGNKSWSYLDSIFHSLHVDKAEASRHISQTVKDDDSVVNGAIKLSKLRQVLLRNVWAQVHYEQATTWWHLTAHQTRENGVISCVNSY